MVAQHTHGLDVYAYCAEGDQALRDMGDVKRALKDSAEALELLWAAIGDALMSGKGIETAYAQSVASKVDAAARQARLVCGWNDASGYETPGDVSSESFK